MNNIALYSMTHKKEELFPVRLALELQFIMTGTVLSIYPLNKGQVGKVDITFQLYVGLG